jgi:hypothetical protein
LDFVILFILWLVLLYPQLHGSQWCGLLELAAIFTTQEVPPKLTWLFFSKRTYMIQVSPNSNKEIFSPGEYLGLFIGELEGRLNHKLVPWSKYSVGADGNLSNSSVEVKSNFGVQKRKGQVRGIDDGELDLKSVSWSEKAMAHLAGFHPLPKWSFHQGRLMFYGFKSANGGAYSESTDDDQCDSWEDFRRKQALEVGLRLLLGIIAIWLSHKFVPDDYNSGTVRVRRLNALSVILGLLGFGALLLPVYWYDRCQQNSEGNQANSHAQTVSLTLPDFPYHNTTWQT